MTQRGGPVGDGTVFALNVDGTGFHLLHTFSGGTNGASPVGGLALVGSTLYGATNGTASNTIFQVNTDGTGFHVLRYLQGSDGASPSGDFTLIGSTLFSTTQAQFFTSYYGTTFSIAIPEPSTLVLAALGFAGLVAWRKRVRAN